MGKYYRERGKAVKEGKAPAKASVKEQKQKEAKETLFQRIQGAQIVASKWGCPSCKKGPVSLQSAKTKEGTRVQLEPTFNCKSCGSRGKLQDLIAYGAKRAASEAGEFIDAVNERSKMEAAAQMPEPNKEIITQLPPPMEPEVPKV